VATHLREVKEATRLRVVKEVTLHKVVKEATLLKEDKEVIPLRVVKGVTLLKEVKAATLLKEDKEAIPLKEARVPLLLLPQVADLTPPPLSPLQRSLPHPRAPPVLAPPTQTPAVLESITPSDTTRMAPWPRSRRGSIMTISTPSRWSTGGRLTRESGLGSQPCFRTGDSSAAAPLSPGSTSSLRPTAWLT